MAPKSDLTPWREAAAALRHIWREGATFFLSIELWMMVLLSWVTVAGFWLAYTGNLLALPVFGAAIGYVVLRIALHLRRILAWPFL